MQEVEIVSIKEVDECDVYDISNYEKSIYLNEPNFIINGVVVHNCGKHAGGIVILDEPIYERVPVIRVQGELATAFTESGNQQELDELGLVKYDKLSISQLDVIDETLNLAEKEGFYLIEDDDGIQKIVSKAYLLERGISEEEINIISN